MYRCIVRGAVSVPVDLYADFTGRGIGCDMYQVVLRAVEGKSTPRSWLFIGAGIARRDGGRGRS